MKYLRIIFDRKLVFAALINYLSFEGYRCAYSFSLVSTRRWLLGRGDPDLRGARGQRLSQHRLEQM